METKGTTGEETTSYWFDLPIDVAEFEEKLGIGAENGDYRIIEKVLPYADEVHEQMCIRDRYITLAVIYLLSFSILLGIQFIVYRPLCKITEAAKQYASGNLDLSLIHI